jgi:catechol 2,3-dioxygenase-like lactoylglutathione lyase family enzyme
MRRDRKTKSAEPMIGKGAKMTSWEKYVDVVILFAEDLKRSKSFYQDVFAVATDHEDRDSVSFRLGDTVIILLDIAAAKNQISPAKVASRDAGSRLLITIFVADVDAVAGELAGKGVELINGPNDRPSGERTACFADPAGHIWEIAQDLRLTGKAEGSPKTAGWEKSEKSVDRVSVFVDDLDQARAFYQRIFGLPADQESHGAASFRFQNLIVTLLDVPGARELIAPAAVASREAGSRSQFTNFMDPDHCDVDAACAELAEHGVELISGPLDRPWGKRTAVFADAGGCIWELAQNVGQA